MRMDIENWYTQGQSLLGPLIGTISKELDAQRAPAVDTHLAAAPRIALHYFVSCLDISGTANERGMHAVAISLTRLSIEALTIIEIGLISQPLSTQLLNDWDTGRKSQGQIRKELETCVWPSYGSGLWTEPWVDFARNLAKSVQPYAHYSPELLQWQLLNIPGSFDGEKGRVGLFPGYVDLVKGYRVSLLHVLATWALGRILFANRPGVVGFVTRQQIDDLGVELASSRLLMKGKDWGVQLWPHLFLK